MPQPTTELLPEVQDASDEASTLVIRAEGVVVASDKDYERAGELGVEVQTRIRKIEDFRDRQLGDWQDQRRDALASMRRLEADYAPFLEPLERAKQLVKDGMTAWRKEQMRQERIDAERAAAVAAKQAEKERRERDKIAKSLEKKGLEAEAEDVRARATVAIAPVATYRPPTPKVRNVVEKREKRAKFDMAAQYIRLQAAISFYNEHAQPKDGIVPHNYWKLDEKALQKEVKRTDGMVPIPGCEFYDHVDTELRKR